MWAAVSAARAEAQPAEGAPPPAPPPMLAPPLGGGPGGGGGAEAPEALASRAGPAARARAESSPTVVRYRLDDFVAVGDGLGGGSFGQVAKVVNKKSGDVFAMKTILKRKIEEYQLADQLAREVKTQLRLKHPCILALHYYFEDQDNVHMLLEYARGGSLFHLLRRRGCLEQKQAARYFVHVASALDHLHQKGVIHRDLKPENILMCEGDVAKLADFGWCAEIDQGELRNTFCGTVDYLSPEMVNNEPHDHGVDIWALGVLLYEMLTSKAPFAAGSQMKTMTRIIGVDLQPPHWVDTEAKDLLRRLLVKDKSARLPLSMAREHPWVREHVPDAERPASRPPSLPPSPQHGRPEAERSEDVAVAPPASAGARPARLCLPAGALCRGASSSASPSPGSSDCAKEEGRSLPPRGPASSATTPHVRPGRRRAASGRVGPPLPKVLDRHGAAETGKVASAPACLEGDAAEPVSPGRRKGQSVDHPLMEVLLLRDGHRPQVTLPLPSATAHLIQALRTVSSPSVKVPGEAPPCAAGQEAGRRGGPRSGGASGIQSEMLKRSGRRANTTDGALQVAGAGLDQAIRSSSSRNLGRGAEGGAASADVGLGLRGHLASKQRQLVEERRRGAAHPTYISELDLGECSSELEEPQESVAAGDGRAGWGRAATAPEEPSWRRGDEDDYDFVVDSFGVSGAWKQPPTPAGMSPSCQQLRQGHWPPRRDFLNSSLPGNWSRRISPDSASPTTLARVEAASPTQILMREAGSPTHGFAPSPRGAFHPAAGRERSVPAFARRGDAYEDLPASSMKRSSSQTDLADVALLSRALSGASSAVSSPARSPTRTRKSWPTVQEVVKEPPMDHKLSWDRGGGLL